MPTRCNRGFYYRSYCMLNMFRAPLCPSSGVQEYYTVVAACGISCCDFQVAGLVWSNHCIILLSSWWWAYWCPKHVKQAIRSAIKTSVASSWNCISTYYILFFSLSLSWRDSSLVGLDLPPHSRGMCFLDHTQRHTTVGRTPLDEWSATRRDIYLTTYNTLNRQTSTPPVGFEHTISAGERS